MIDRYTSGLYLETNPSWHEEDSAWKASQIAGFLQATNIAPRTLVEVGCGAGGVLEGLQRKLPPDCQLTGYDISSEAIARCRQKENDRLSFVNGDYRNLSSPAADLLLVVDVLEHIEDCFGFLRSLRGRARHFVFHIPLDMHISAVARVHPLLEARRHVGHIHYFLRETALAMLSDTGYRVLRERYTAGGLELGSAGRRAIILRTVRRSAFRVAPHVAARWLGGFSLLVLAEAAPAHD